MYSNPKQREYILPKSLCHKHKGTTLQYYYGEFFSLFVTSPANGLIHQQITRPFHLPDQQVNLVFQHTNFVFEVRLSNSEVQEYIGLAGDTNLNGLVPLWPLEMEGMVLDFFNRCIHPSLADHYLYIRVVDLLLALGQHVLTRKEMSENYWQHLCAQKAKELILQDFSVYHSVRELARLMGVSELVLQQAFKQRYGMTVGAFSKNARMQLARMLLDNPTEKLLSVALSIGYNDPGNFSVAFKKYFGYSPGLVQKRRKTISGSF